MSGLLPLLPPTALDYFASLVAEDASLPLLETAVAIAQHDYPRLDVQATLAEIDTLAARLKRRIAADAAPMQRLRLLNRFFFQELGFSGNVNDYYDPRNSYVHCVLRDPARHPDHPGAALRRARQPGRARRLRHLLPRPLPGQGRTCRRARS